MRRGECLYILRKYNMEVLVGLPNSDRERIYLLFSLKSKVVLRVVS